MKFVDVTLVGISCEFASEGGPVEVSGRLSAGAMKRNGGWTGLDTLFASLTPIEIEVGKTFAINKTVTVTLLSNVFEVELAGEYLGLGGRVTPLSIGQERRLITPAQYYHEGGDMRHVVRFADDDGTQQVRADFVVRWSGGG